MFEFESVSLDDIVKEFTNLNIGKMVLSKAFPLVV